jgi:hypothetical protein
MGASANTARVFILEDPCFETTRLSAIVRGAACEPLAPIADAPLAATLDSLLPSPELMIVPICPGGEEILEAVRKRHWLRMVPILATSPANASRLDLWRLRGFGIVGLIDPSATAEHVRFRIEEVIAARSCGPRDIRVPCCFLVDIDALGAFTSEYALSFSIGGIGLASARPLEPNTEVRLWLPLTEAPGRVEVPGRVVRCHVRADGRHDVGIVFLPLPASVRELLTRELRGLLLALGLQLGQQLQAASSGPPDASRVAAMGSDGRVD